MVSGYVRNNCDSLNIEMIPNDIILLLAIWVTLSDSFDTTISDPEMEIKSIEIDPGVSVEAVSRKPIKTLGGWASAQTAFGKDIVKKGDVHSWRFQLVSKPAAETEFIIGIIDKYILEQMQNKPNFTAVSDFTGSDCKGYGLWKGTGGNLAYYHVSGASLPYAYAASFKYKFRTDDIISMTLDMRDAKNGTLSYTIDTKEDVNVPDNVSNIASSDVKVDGEYRLAISWYTGESMLALLD